MMSSKHLQKELRVLLAKSSAQTNMIFAICFLLASGVVVNSQIVGNVRDYRINPYYDESPKPYSFNYNAILDDGVGESSRTETADGSGRVQGSYSLRNEEGHIRIVDYIADQDGFRASIRTNEPGTDNKNPADVVIESAGPYSDRPFQYSPVVRRPVLNVAAEPVAPVEVAPENIIPPAPRPPVYRRPTYNRNYQYRPRSPYNRYGTR